MNDAVVTRFKKKQIVVEAAQLSGYGHIDIEIFHWIGSHIGIIDYCDIPNHTQGVSIDPTNGDLLIKSLDGILRASIGDWVIRGVMGEFYPCKPHVFASSYGPA